MTKILILAAALLASTSMAFADYTLPSMPKKFQGTWTCAVGPTTIGANSVSFGSGYNNLKLFSIVPGDEELNTVIVKWLPNPGALVVASVWKLVKFNGRQFLMDINEESPSSATLCLKK
jgi:hypothetical protein